jgi:apolipoprotein N-acyltransferase
MTALVGAVVSGVLYGLSFPPFNFSTLAWIAFLPLLLSTGPTRRELFRNGFVTGFVANEIVFFWLWKTFLIARIGWPTTLVIWILMAMVLAVYFGAFAYVAGRLPDGGARPWLAALAWIVLETVRSHIMTGFPWALFGHTQAYNRPLLQLVSVTGEPGISFLLVAANVALVAFLKTKRRAALLNLVLILIIRY